MTDVATHRTVKTACNRDCGDACSIIATVENNRITKIAGDPDHPITKGFLCHRTSRFLERQYSPDRLTTPLVKDGDGFRPASWETVLNRIAESMLRFREQSGPASIMHYRCGGSMGMMKLVTDYFFERFGPVTIKSGDVCTGAGDAAQELDFGTVDSHDIFDLLNSKTIILWGKNPYASQVHLLPVLRDAKKNGARLILIDPVHHQTAQLCDQHVQPRPGGDAALALGIARSLFDNGKVDPSVNSYCDNVGEFRSLACSKTVEQWASQADVSPDEIISLAVAYSDGPSAIIAGWGMQRRTNGAATVRAIDALAAVSGNLGVPGGGVSYCFARKGAFDYSFLKGEAVAPRTIPEPMFGPGILAANDPPIRMVWVTAANPVVMLPESETVKRALETRDLTVVVDSFLTDTAQCADIVLPTTTMLEDDDLLGAYGHHWLAEMRPVVAPPEQVKTDYEIVQALAPLVGLGNEFSDDVETWKQRMLSPGDDRGASLDEIRRGPVRSPNGPSVMFADRKFPTATGRANLTKTVDTTPSSATAERPLLLTSLATAAVQGSQWLNGAQDDHLPATVHPDSASGFNADDVVTLESEHGQLTVRLKLAPNQRRDIILVPKGGWLNKGRCANALIKAQTTDAGDCAVYYDTPVRIRPSEEAESNSQGDS
ncbi:MAG: anaerobic selenocysteine-containing dehydrogenase [Planctomycetaceae bacterium]|jgi:anaerobic selenocysteine-containing dehydrogenase